MTSLLICCTPVHGHVTPLLAVARHLCASGHRVQFLTGHRYRDAVRSTGAEFVPLPDEADYDDRDMDAAFPGRVGRTGVDGIRWDMREIFLAPAPAQLAAVDDVLAAGPVDAVLAEGLFVGALLLLSRPASSRPPVINLGIFPLGLPSRDTAPFGLGIAPMPGLLGRLRNTALTVISDRVLFAPLQREARRIVRESTGAELRTPFLAWPALCDAIAQFTVPSFEYPRSDLRSDVRFVGPVSRTTPSTGPLPDWWSDLDADRPVVHVTQGTVANADVDDLIGPTVEGLAADDVLVVVSTGNRELPARLRLSNVRTAAYLPYDRLLPRTDVFVTNGGYGGVHYALEHAVPIVAAGRTEDKAEVNARIAWSGVGIDLRSSRPSATDVRAAVMRVLAEPSYRRHSARIGQEIVSSPGLAGLDDILATVGASTVAAPRSA